MAFGFDIGLIGGVLVMPAFKAEFGLDDSPVSAANLSANIVSILQAGAFFGSLSAIYTADKLGRKKD